MEQVETMVKTSKKENKDEEEEDKMLFNMCLFLLVITSSPHEDMFQRSKNRGRSSPTTTPDGRGWVPGGHGPQQMFWAGWAGSDVSRSPTSGNVGGRLLRRKAPGVVGGGEVQQKT